jgi:hypothetical protein
MDSRDYGDRFNDNDSNDGVLRLSVPMLTNESPGGRGGLVRASQSPVNDTAGYAPALPLTTRSPYNPHDSPFSSANSRGDDAKGVRASRIAPISLRSPLEIPRAGGQCRGPAVASGTAEYERANTAAALGYLSFPVRDVDDDVSEPDGEFHDKHTGALSSSLAVSTSSAQACVSPIAERSDQGPSIGSSVAASPDVKHHLYESTHRAFSASRGKEDAADQVLPLGHSRFLCGSNSIFWAKDAGSSVVVAIVILAVAAVSTFSWLQGNSSRRAEQPAVILLTWLLAICDTIFLFATVLRCPGIVPKCTGGPSNQPPDGMILLVEHTSGVKIFRPYCYVCNINRPPRAAHCPICNNCVERYDHHCGMIGACIGKENFASFARFLVTTVLYALWMVSSSVFLLVRLFETDNRSATENVIVGLLFLIATVSAGIAVLVGRMIWFQLAATLMGLTQREFVKLTMPHMAADRNKLFDPPTSNPYNHGAISNVLEMCC